MLKFFLEEFKISDENFIKYFRKAETVFSKELKLAAA